MVYTIGKLGKWRSMVEHTNFNGIARVKMSLMKIEAKLQGGEPVTAEYDVGDTLAEAVEKFGEDRVYSRYRAAIIIDIQAYMRGLLKQTDPGLNGEQIATLVGQWQPGVKARGKTGVEKASEIWARLSEEERAAFLAEIQDAL